MGLEVPWVAELQTDIVVGAPGFEGFEKRLEVEFVPGADDRGLRAISRNNLDRMLKAAECTIVAQLSNKDFDSYVLSESSLFVYPHRIVIKTCGTTKLLRAIPVLLELADELHLSVRSCKYRRGTFYFPKEQPFPHRNFPEEVAFLNEYFGGLGSGGKGYVLGDPSSTRLWHVYVASVDETLGSAVEPTYTLEMCMTGLNRKVATKFYKDVNSTAAEMAMDTGIDGLLPNSKLCDFVFDPCGYSMNSVEDGAYSTIHVTPEEACSYASFEAMGYGPESVDLKTLVDKVVAVFKPSFVSVSLYAAGVNDEMKEKAGTWDGSFCPTGYKCVGSNRQEVGSQEGVVYHTFEVESSEDSAVFSVVPAALFDGDGGSCEYEKIKLMKKMQVACSV